MDRMDNPYLHNPIMPLDVFIPDVEARQWEDGRIYVYGSYDIGGQFEYCSTLYHVYSSEDFLHWLDHGVSFRSKGPGDQVPWSDCNLYAPDCICKDGRYYLYFC